MAFKSTFIKRQPEASICDRVWHTSVQSVWSGQRQLSVDMDAVL